MDFRLNGRKSPFFLSKEGGLPLKKTNFRETRRMKGGLRDEIEKGTSKPPVRFRQTDSRSFLPGLNFTTLAALILSGAPVWGLRPVLAFLRVFKNVPNPINVTFPFFFFKDAVIFSTNESSAAFA
jgi:hypothetical protein